jgi:hypothetical protein
LGGIYLLVKINYFGGIGNCEAVDQSEDDFDGKILRHKLNDCDHNSQLLMTHPEQL